MISGAVVSTTVIKVLHETLLPAASNAVIEIPTCPISEQSRKSSCGPPEISPS